MSTRTTWQDKFYHFNTHPNPWWILIALVWYVVVITLITIVQCVSVPLDEYPLQRGFGQYRLIEPRPVRYAYWV